MSPRGTRIIIGMFGRARASFGERVYSGLAAVAEERDDEGDYLEVEFADIAVEPIEWRQQLEAKNQGFDNLSSGYITGYARRPPRP